MQLNKVFHICLGVLFPIYCYSLQAQPGPTKYYFNGSFTFNDCKKKNIIQFETKDSITFYSKKITFKIYEVSKTDSVSRKQYLKLGNKNHFYLFLNRNDSYFLKNINSIIVDDNIILNQKATIFEINKKRKKMYIYIDFSKYKSDIDLGVFNIYFQEGEYKITNTIPPQLIKIKEKKL